jgi:hypothetical protein
MRLGVTHSFCWRHDSETNPKAVADQAQEAIARFSEAMEFDRWSGWIVPLKNAELRQRVFDAYCAAVPRVLHPCREILYVRDVTIDDLRQHRWALCLKFLPSPSESELEKSSLISYRADREECPACGRRGLRQGTTKRIAPRVLQKYKGAVQLPNHDAFCTADFATVLQQQGMTGFHFTERDRTGFEITPQMHEFASDIQVCGRCGAALMDGFTTVLEHKHTYRYDIQAVSTEVGLEYVVSQRLVELLLKRNPKAYQDSMKLGALVPLFSEEPLRLMRS